MPELDDSFRTQLDDERGRLVSELAELGVGTDEAPEYDDNFADTSQVTAERGESEALAASLQETLRDVEAALARLDDGTYGRCVTCGREIGHERLVAMPSTPYCIDHASQG